MTKTVVSTYSYRNTLKVFDRLFKVVGSFHFLGSHLCNFSLSSLQFKIGIKGRSYERDDSGESTLKKRVLCSIFTSLEDRRGQKVLGEHPEKNGSCDSSSCIDLRHSRRSVSLFSVPHCLWSHTLSCRTVSRTTD